MPDVPDAIDCIDCGGRCHRISFAPEEGFAIGDVVAYRCGDCLDRWDLEVGGLDDGGAGDDAGAGEPGHGWGR